MNLHPLQPEIGMIGLCSAILFLIGVFNYFYDKKFQSDYLFISLFYLVTSYFLFYLITAFRLFSVPFFFPEQPILSMANLILFLGFSFLGANTVLPRLSLRFQVVYILILGMVLFPVLYWIFHSGVLANLHFADRSGFLFLILGAGSLIWFHEIFFSPSGSDEKNLQNQSDSGFSYLIFLPWACLISSKLIPNEVYLNLGLELLLIGGASGFGFFLLFKIRKHENDSFPAIIGFLSGIGFSSSSAGISLALLLPISFVLGIVLQVFHHWLTTKLWSPKGAGLFTGLLVAGTVGVFSPLLTWQNTDLPHPHLTMLGVQAIGLLTVFLLSSLSASLLFFLLKQSRN
ncbi:hypothetical protein [Leptospira sp. 'Mane']|uniref:hypothetical protein n=1 Tax=Leptospira sp. 'Mane' TaxID=3387407 RepID=UPI00398AF419